MSWATISALPRRTPRERQVWEATARSYEAAVNQRREARALFDRQNDCERTWGHFLTAPMPDLDGKRRCIACEAVVE